MRTTIYVAAAIAALFISSSDARGLNKRVGANAVTGLDSGATGALGTVTKLTNGIVSPGGIEAQQQRKKKRGLGGGLLGGGGEDGTEEAGKHVSGGRGRSPQGKGKAAEKKKGGILGGAIIPGILKRSPEPNARS